ncbi:unnamed protein product, partial [Vitis vinifera]
MHLIDLPFRLQSYFLHMQKLVDYIGLPCRIARGCKYCVANALLHFSRVSLSHGFDAHSYGRVFSCKMVTSLKLGTLGRTVVCTIHQPSIDIFDAFDELFLLKQGGEEIYAGPLEHHSAHLIKYFEGIDGVSKIKDGYNPATWMLEVTSAAQEAALGINFTDVYKNSELYR